MAKFGIGVGEEFPVNEPPARNASESDADYAERRRYWRHHHYLHLATRLAVVALIVSFIVWMFIPHPPVPMPMPAGMHGPYGFHHHFFFPFPLLLILLFVLAWRGFGRRHSHHHHHRHDEPRSWRDREEA